jgi:hypothetical protein
MHEDSACSGVYYSRADGAASPITFSDPRGYDTTELMVNQVGVGVGVSWEGGWAVEGGGGARGGGSDLRGPSSPILSTSLTPPQANTTATPLTPPSHRLTVTLLSPSHHHHTPITHPSHTHHAPIINTRTRTHTPSSAAQGDGGPKAAAFEPAGPFSAQRSVFPRQGDMVRCVLVCWC